MCTEVCKLHYFPCVGYLPVYFKQLLLNEKQITIHQVINLHETPGTRICHLERASSKSEGMKSLPCQGPRGLRKEPSHLVTLCFILGHPQCGLKVSNDLMAPGADTV